MQILRLSFFLGLVLRRLLLEVLRRRDKVPLEKRPSITFIKFFKGFVQVFIVFQTLFLDLLPISEEPIPLIVVGTTLYLVGLVTTITGRLQLGNNWADLEDYQVLPKQSLVTNGIYRYIRHPIYTGDLLLFTGLELALNSWLVLGMSVPVLLFIRQALAEEALLSRSFPEYSAYCAQTWRFIPFVL